MGSAKAQLRAGIYVRISDDRTGLEAGVRRQEVDCRELAAQRGWEVADVFKDNDISAFSGKKRPAFEALQEAVREGRIKAIVAWHPDRLYRRAILLEDLVRFVEETRVQIATVTAGDVDLSTPTGRLQARVVAAVAQHESEQKGERSARAKADLKSQGKWLGGGAPAFGYRREKDDRGKVTHRVYQPEAKLVREIVRRTLAGESLTRLAVDLNRRGLTTPRGRPWQPSRLRQLMTSPFHAGRFADGTPGNWPAIITEDQHVLLRARFPSNRGVGRGRGARAPIAYRLSGLARCSECDRKLLGSGGAYRCQPRNGGCGRVRIAAWATDQLVEDAVFAREQTWAADPTRGAGEPASADDGSEALVAEMQSIEARRLALAEDFAADRIAREDYIMAAEALARRKSETEARIREQSPSKRTDWAALAALVKEGLSAAEWSDFLSKFVERIVITPALRRGRAAIQDVPARVSITWRHPE